MWIVKAAGNIPATSMDLDTIKILSSGGLGAALMIVLIWIQKTNKESIDANTKALTAFRLTFARWAGGLRRRDARQH